MVDSQYEQFFFDKKVVDENRKLEALKNTSVLDYLYKEDKVSENYFKNYQNLDSIKELVVHYNYKSNFEIKNLKIISKSNWLYLKKTKSDSLYSLFAYSPIDGQERLIYKNNKRRIMDIYPSPNGQLAVIAFSYKDGDFATLLILALNRQSTFIKKIENAWPRFGSINWINNLEFSYQSIPVIDANSPDYLFDSEVNMVTIDLENSVFDISTIFSSDSHINISREDRVYVIPSLRGSKSVGVVVGSKSYTNAYIRNTGTTEEWKPLWTIKDKIYGFRLTDSLIYFTRYNKQGKIVLNSTNLDEPNFDKPQVILEEGDWVLGDFVINSNGLFFTKVYNGIRTELVSISSMGKESIIDIPGTPGRVKLNSRCWNCSSLWIEVDSWVSSNEIFLLNNETDTFVRFKSKDDGIEIDDYKILETEVESFDGVMVPLSLIYKKGNTNITNGSAPLLINGYGAFGSSLKPYKYKFILPWIENGGVYAVAHVRGGGEKGKSWRDAGKKNLKPNTWKDFIALTEYLVSNNFVDANKIVSWAGSAGAICTGRAMIDRPDLYAGAIFINGKLNTMRGESEPGVKNVLSEYGTIETKEGFESIFNMDCYHNLKSDVDYPAIYLRASLNDTRVPAYHSAKFHTRINKLFDNRKSMLDILPEGGHGFGLTQDERIEETVRMLAFAFDQIQHPTYFSSSD